MSELYGFGEFMLDPRRRTLSRAGSGVSLTPKAFDVLLFLVQNPNRLVTKEELLQSVWGDAFVEEGNLTQYISHLRKALGDNAEDTRLIVTIARKGYQFTGDVAVAETEENAKQASPPGALTETSMADTRLAELPAGKEAAEFAPSSSRLRLREWSAAFALLAIIGAGFWFYSSFKRSVTLSPTDTIVLADVSNQTSDPVFDDALNATLRYGLDQTPYLDILGTDKVLGALAQLNLPPTTKLTPEIARQVCLRTNSKLVISQSIGDAGNGYHFELRALDCGSGSTEAREQAEIGERVGV